MRMDYDDDFEDTDRGGGAALPMALGPQQLAIQTSIGDMVQVRRAAIAVPREIATVRRTIKEMAQWVASTGQFDADTWEYRFPVKNKRTGKTELIEGPTVKCTNAVARAYGNCSVDATRVEEKENSYFIYSTFIDYQSGFQTTRVFRQRKGQVTMGGDAERGEDIVFQIGVSKSMRNVINNALGDMVEYAIHAKRQRLVGRIEEDPERFRQKIRDRCQEIGYSLSNIEAWTGYGKIDKWPSPAIAQVLQILAAHAEGALANLDDVFAPGAKDLDVKDAPKPVDASDGASTSASEPAKADGAKVETAGQQSTGSTKEAVKRSRRGYHKIVEDVLAMLAKAGDGAEVDRILKDEVTSGVRTNPELMGKINAAAADALARLSQPKDQPKADQPAEAVVSFLGRPMATWDAAIEAVEHELAAAEQRGGRPEDMEDETYNEIDRAIGLLAAHRPEVADMLARRLDVFVPPDDAQQGEAQPQPPGSTGGKGAQQASAAAPPEDKPAGELFRLHDGKGDDLGGFPAREYLTRLGGLLDAASQQKDSGYRIAQLRTRNQGSMELIMSFNADDAALMGVATQVAKRLGLGQPAGGGASTATRTDPKSMG